MSCMPASYQNLKQSRKLGRFCNSPSTRHPPLLHGMRRVYRHVGRTWDNVLVASVGPPLDKRYEGKSIAEIAKMRNEDEWDTFFDLAQTGSVSVNPKSMDEEQKRVALRTAWV